MARAKKKFCRRDDTKEEERLEKKRALEDRLEKNEKKRKQVSDLIKHALDDQQHDRKPDYSSMNKIVQQWIKDDQQRRLNGSVNNDEVLDVSLLKQVPRDIIFDIIDFVPTYSERAFTNNLNYNVKRNAKASGISVEDLLKEVPDALNPEKLRERRKFECAMTLDCKFLTFHKMRLICKEYALRMKHKIFSIENLDLTYFDLDNQHFVVKLLSFLKDQQYYHDQHECENILMYFHFQQIKDVILVSANSLPTSDDEEESMTEKMVDTIKELQTSNDSNQVIVKSPVNDTTAELVVAAPISTEEEEELSPFEDDSFNIYTSHLDLIPCHPENIENHKYMYQNSLPIELSSLRVLPTYNCFGTAMVLKQEKLSPIIGVNTVLRSLKFSGDLSYDLSPIILLSCLNLKKISLFSSSLMVDPDDTSIVHDNLEILEFVFPSNDTYEMFDSIVMLIKLFPNLTTISIAIDPCNSFIVEEIQQTIDGIDFEDNTKRLVFSIDGTHYKDITPTGRARKWPIVNILNTTLNSLSSSYFTNIILNTSPTNTETIIYSFFCDDDDIGIERKKEFMDLLFIDSNYPIEGKFDGNVHPLLFQYAIYIANEYQNGRLFSVYSNHTEDAIRYGWQIGKSWDEVLKFLNVKNMKMVLSYLRKQYNNDTKFFKFIRTLILDYCILFHGADAQSGLLALIDYLKNEKFNFSDIFSPVRCIADSESLTKFNLQTLHIPFLSYPIFSNFLYIPISILSFAKEEDLFYQNENGDTLLTAVPNSDISFSLIDIILKKVPQLAKISNKQNRTPLHIFASHEITDMDWILYCKETYGFDANQTDIVGKTAMDYMTIQSQIICRMFD